MNEQVVLERHPHLYFDDGDVVLTAKSAIPEGQPSKYQIYRVHTPVLRHHSQVFANLFDALPCQVYEEVPLVKMVGDEAEAEQRNTCSTPCSNTLSASLLKIGLSIPRNGTDRKARSESCDPHRSSLGNFTGPRRPLFHSIPEPASSICFAQEFGCHEILPAAFYQLSRTDPSDDWPTVGYVGDSNTNADDQRPARWSLLGRNDLFRYIKGCRAIEDFCRGFKTIDWTHVLSTRCLPSWYHPEFPEQLREEAEKCMVVPVGPCHTLIRQLLDRLWDAGPVRDPMKWLTECRDYGGDVGLQQEFPRGLCRRCDNKFTAWIHAKREELWASLPGYFECTVLR